MEDIKNPVDILINHHGGESYSFVRNSFVELSDIKAGFYGCFTDAHGQWFFERNSTPKDEKLFADHLKLDPDEEDYFPIEEYHSVFEKIHEDVEAFLNNKEFYTNNRIQYRRAYLVFGEAGIGKTRFFDHLIRRLIRDHDAICMSFSSPRNLLGFYEAGYKYYSRALRDRLKVFMIDEFSEFTDVHGHETKSEVNHALLNLLDNASQNENTLFFFCTNHPESIPDNIIDRPSRIDVLKEAGLDGFDKERFIKDWYEFIMKRPFPMDAEGKLFLRKTQAMSPAYFKEIFVYAFQQGMSLLEAYEIQIERKKMVANRFKRASEVKSAGKKQAGFSLDEVLDPEFEDSTDEDDEDDDRF